MKATDDDGDENEDEIEQCLLKIQTDASGKLVSKTKC